MEKTTKKQKMPIMAGILFVVIALRGIIGLLDLPPLFEMPSVLLEMVGAVMISLACFSKAKTKKLLPVGVILMIISRLFKCLYDVIGYFNMVGVIVAFILGHVLIAGGFFVALLIILKSPKLPEEQACRLKKLWYLPALAFVLEALVYKLFLPWIMYSLVGIFSKLIYIAAWALMMYHIVFPDGKPKKEKLAQEPGALGQSDIVEEGYCDIIKHILLLFFTFGIWLYIWIYRTTKFLNHVKGEEYRDPTKKLLLCMFVPFYSVFWTYKSAQRIDKLAKERGVASDLATLCLILALFVGIVPPILMQEKINGILKAESQPAVSNDVEELKKYQELLTAGIITKEEFEAKRKQILGLS